MIYQIIHIMSALVPFKKNHVIEKSTLEKKTVLLITSSGGTGHLQAAKAQIAKTQRENPHAYIIQKDILIDWLGNFLGRSFVLMWNRCQKKGHHKALRFFSSQTPIADLIFWPYVFCNTLSTILSQDVDHIIDTQFIGTSPIIKAIKIARKLTNKPLILEKVLTELPTDHIAHLLKPIKSLSSPDRTLIKLISTSPPLLQQGQTAEAFWQRYCGLSETEVCYQDLPLRPHFAKLYDRSQHPKQKLHIQIKVKNAIEKFIVTDTIKKGNLQSDTNQDYIAITIEPEDRVATILLGSQPTEKATIQYVKKFIDIIHRTAHAQKRHLLFVFCNNYAEPRNSLLRRVHAVIQQASFYPSCLNIIPMCFQDDEVIATLYQRSNATFTRSGGLTSMELLAVAQGQIWIHSEVKQKQATNEELAKGMPVWEKGNALYLQQTRGAKFITPATFFDTCIDYFLPESTA